MLTRSSFASIPFLLICTNMLAMDKGREKVTIIENLPTTSTYNWFVDGKASVTCSGATCSAYIMPGVSGTAQVEGAILKVQRPDGTIVIAECVAKERVGADAVTALAGVTASSTYRSCRMPEPNGTTPVEAEFHLAAVKLFFQTPSTDASGKIFSETYRIKGFLHLQPSSTVTSLSSFERENGSREISCGSEDTKVDVHTDKNKHPLSSPDPSHALIYIIQKNEFSVALIGSFPTRYALDGQWVAGDSSNSYFYFPVAPGEHHLCGEWSIKFSHHIRPFSLAKINVAAGESYFFLSRNIFAGLDGQRSITLEPLSAEEAQQLIEQSALSTTKIK